MKQMNLVSGVGFAFAAVFAVGCASSASPATTALAANHECAAPAGYVVSTTNAGWGTGAATGTPIVNPDSRALEGRGIAMGQSATVAARTVASTDRGRGDSLSCY